MKLRITIFLFLLVSIYNFGQVTIGSKTANSDVLTKADRAKAHAQFIYYSSEIGTANFGDVYKLKFYFEDEVTDDEFNKIKNWEVRLGTTAGIEYHKGPGWSDPPVETFLTGTPNFSGDIVLHQDRKTIEIAFPIANRFNYTGTQNLVVDILQDTPGKANVKLQSFNDGWSSSLKKRCIYEHPPYGPGANLSGSPKKLQKKLPVMTMEVIKNTPYELATLKTTQLNAGKKINFGTTDVEIIALNVKIKGKNAAKKNIEQLTYNLAGTTNNSDLSNYKLYYGINSIKGQATQVTSAVFNNNGTITINKELESGDNYFFITADIINDGGAVGRKIDVNITELDISGTTYNSSTPIILSTDTVGDITISIDPIIVRDQTNEHACGRYNTTSVGPIADYKDPVYTHDGNFNSWSAMLYTPAELGLTAKNITKIGFYLDCRVSAACDSPEATNQTIYMKLVDTNVISDGSLTHPDGPTLNGFTKVFEGGIIWKYPYWGNGVNLKPTIIDLDVTSSGGLVPDGFEYDGTKNILVYFKNQHGGRLGAGYGCNGDPSFLYSTGIFHESNKKMVGGHADINGVRKVGDEAFSGLAVTYFEYTPSTTTVAPSITKMPTNTEICSTDDNYTIAIGDVEVNPQGTLMWRKSTNAGGTLTNDTSLTPTYSPVASDKGKTITLTLKASNAVGFVEDSFTITFNEKPSAVIKRIK